VADASATRSSHPLALKHVVPLASELRPRAVHVLESQSFRDVCEQVQLEKSDASRMIFGGKGCNKIKDTIAKRVKQYTVRTSQRWKQTKAAFL